MKKNLGKLLLFLLLSSLLDANSLATYKLFATKTDAYVKEPIEITFIAKQENHTDNMFFLLEPDKSPDYEIKLLKKITNNKRHDSLVTFSYLLFPLKAKKIILNFDFTIQTVSDQALAQSSIDDHDGSKAVQIDSSKKIDVKPLILKIKNIPQDVAFVGDFTLQSQCSTQQITQYDDVNIIYTVQGRGYKNYTNNILNTIAHVNQFSDVHDTYSRLTKDGYISKRIYTYALSAKQNFTIPPLHLKAFSFKTDKVYMLEAPSYPIEVTKINPLTLLDKKESPTTEDIFSTEVLKQYSIYILLFIFGFISAKFSNINLKREKKKKIFQDIKETTSQKELIMLLINKYQSYDIKEFVNKLEKLEYEKSTQSFSSIKKELLEVLSFR